MPSVPSQKPLMSSDTIIRLLKTCAQKKDLYGGSRLHGDLIAAEEDLLEKNLSVGNALINMYAKCGAMGKAQETFNDLKMRDEISWNSLISGYAQQGYGNKALVCFDQMQECGFSPDGFTYVATLKACGIIKDATSGKTFHLGIVSYGFLERNNVLGNALIDMYVKCGDVLEAEYVFDKSLTRDVVTWNVLIAGYVKYGFAVDAVRCFDLMEVDGISPDACTFACILKACGIIGDMNKGQEIHAHTQKDRNTEKNVVVGNALMDMYAKCGALTKAKEVFDMVSVRNIVSWNVIIGGYVKQGYDKEALGCFEQMQLMGVSPNQITFVCALKACGSMGASDKGREIHAQIIRNKLMENDIYLSNAVVDMYAKCGLLGKAQEVFDELPFRETNTWNVLISGYIRHGYTEEALNLLDQMHTGLFSPNDVTLLCTLKVCAAIGSVDKGQGVHARLVREGWIENNDNSGSALVHMYTSCGFLIEAQKVFDKLPVADVDSSIALTAGYAENMRVDEALYHAEKMQLLSIPLDVVNFSCLVKACGIIGATDKCHELHAKFVKEGSLETEMVAHTALIDSYAKCGKLLDAQLLFDKLPVRDLVLWNVLISGYTQEEDSEKALHCFKRMEFSGISPDFTTFIFVLKACGKMGALDEGCRVHREILNQGFLEKYAALGTALVDMYAKCGSLEKSEEVFHGLPIWDVITWNAFINGYSRNGLDKDALVCFDWMLLAGNTPNIATFVCISKACGNTGAVSTGQCIHDDIIKQGLLEKSDDVANVLLEMYVKCDMLEEAKEVFDAMRDPNTTSWNVLIAGYCQHGRNMEALSCVAEMQLNGFSPDAFTFIPILKAYSSTIMDAADRNRETHAQIVKLGALEVCNVLGNVLVDSYAKHGMLAEARKVFEMLLVQDVVSWNALISGYSELGKNDEALNCFHWMQARSYLPDAFTFACILKACGSIAVIEKVKALHSQTIIDCLLGRDMVIGNALVDVYAKFGALVEAQEVFDKLQTRDTVSWNTLITGYCVHGNSAEVLTQFKHMELDKISPDVATFLIVLKACGNLGEIYEGQKAHTRIMVEGFSEDNDILGTALVDMYAKSGMLCEAKDIVDKLRVRDIVVWNSLIAGYIQWKVAERAFHCFERIHLEGHPANAITFSHICKACGTEGAAESGKEVHAEIVEDHLEDENGIIAKALVDMYAKCGMLVEAQCLFRALPSRDSVLWNILISGYAQLGNDRIVFALFHRMLIDGEEPNSATLAILLTTCSHVGLPEAGLWCLDITRRGGSCIVPSLEHYNCMLDLLGRLGCLDQIIMLMNGMPFPPNFLTWNTVLGACWKLGDVELGRSVFQHTLQSGKGDSSTYVCMSNIYALQT